MITQYNFDNGPEQSAYLGNPNLKKANVATDTTPEQVQEFIKCANNPVYFIRNYIKIVSLDEGVIPFKMYDFQEKMVMSSTRIDLTSPSCLVSQVNPLLLQRTFCGT